MEKSLIANLLKKHRFQQIKQAQRDHLLTTDGVEYYYKQLLVKDQLLREKSEIEKSDTYQQWKRKSATLLISRSIMPFVTCSL